MFGKQKTEKVPKEEGKSGSHRIDFENPFLALWEPVPFMENTCNDCFMVPRGILVENLFNNVKEVQR